MKSLGGGKKIKLFKLKLFWKAGKTKLSQIIQHSDL